MFCYRRSCEVAAWVYSKTFPFLLNETIKKGPKIRLCQPEKQQYPAQRGSEPLICDLPSGWGLSCCRADRCMRALLLHLFGRWGWPCRSRWWMTIARRLFPGTEARPDWAAASCQVPALRWRRKKPDYWRWTAEREREWGLRRASLNASLRKGLFFHSGLDPKTPCRES